MTGFTQTEKILAKLPKLECGVCKPDIEAFYDISSELVRLNLELVQSAAANVQGGKNFTVGRIVLLYDTVSLLRQLTPFFGVSC